MIGRDVYLSALARLSEFNVNAPSTESASLARAQRYQEQLFARGAVLNREFYGQDGVLILAGNQVDTADLFPIPMRIHVVRVEDPGASTAVVAGQKVALVQLDDQDAELPPRALLRDGIISSVFDTESQTYDLAEVYSLRVYYSKRPAIVEPLVEPQLPEQFHELLVVDLAMWLIRKTLGLTAQAQKDMLDVLLQERDEINADYERFLTEYNFAETSRFGGTVRQG